VISRAKASSAIAAVTCGIALCLGAGPAPAADHPERPELNQEGLSLPCGAATDSRGNLYVAQASPKKVTIYDDEGELLTSFATTASTAFPCSLAVDASGNVYVTGLDKDLARYKPSSFPPTSGTTYAPDTSIGAGSGILVTEAAASVAVDPETQNAYVAQQALGEQHVLNLSGFTNEASKFTLTCDGLTTSEITFSSTAKTRSERIEAALKEKCGPNFVLASQGSGTAAAGTSTITYTGKYLGLDVSPLISCTVTTAPGTCTPAQGREAKPTRISSFEPDGTLISNQIGLGLVPLADFYGIDVHGESGNIYVTDRAHNKALILNPDGSAVLEEIDGAEAPGGAFTAMRRPLLAVDQADGHVFVSDIPGHGVVNEFDQEGKYVAQLTHVPAFTESTSVPSDVAVDSGSASNNRGTIYVTSGDGKVYAFGPDPHNPPLIQLTVEKTGAGAGTVTSAPAGVDCGPTCTGEFASGKAIALSAQPNVAGSLFGAWSGCDSISEGKCLVTMSEARTVSVRFDSRPVVSEQAASQITATSAQLTAQVNPKAKATTYYFEYIGEAEWLANGESFEGAAPASKTSPVAIGSGTSAIAVGVKVQGLAPATAYRFRVLAESFCNVHEPEVACVTEGERDPITDVEIERSFTTYAPPVSFDDDCPNDEFRTGPSANLPDCRAYEQASPVDKNGASIQGSTHFTRSAEDGSTIGFESPAGLPGGSGSQSFPTYIAKRTAEGWATTGLLPNPSSGQEARVLGWTPDFATVFDQARLLDQGRSLLARSTATGSEEQIFPHTLPSPTYRYVGASSDGGTVIFEASGTGFQLTPDAAPGKPNLYAWDRETGEVHLVGVLPDGTTPSEGSRAARGGDTPGGDAGDYNYDTHLVSADGSVFFTDRESGQLYLRLDPTAEGASTLHVSASQKDNGKGPGKRDAAGPQPASFMAASPDGSVVTFLSSEKLTNDATTGPEPEAPAIARAKAGDGGEKDLDFISAFAGQIDIDPVGEYVYWTDPANDRIGRAKLDGTEFDESYITIPDTETEPGVFVPASPDGIAVVNQPTAKYIFWTSPADGEAEEEKHSEAEFEISGEGAIGRADLDGGNVMPDCRKGITNPHAIDANSSQIYWTVPERTKSGRSIGKGDVRSAAFDCTSVGEPPPLIANGLASGDIVVNESHIYVSYVNSFDEGAISIYKLVDGTIVQGSAVLYDNGTNPPGLALDGTHLYWADPDHSKIGRSDLLGTNPSEEHNFIPAPGRAEDLARGGEHLYWTVNQKVAANPGTDLYQLDRDSGELTDLAPDTTDVNGVEARGVLGTSEDGSYVYFAANGVPDGVGNSPNEEGENAVPGNCKGSGDAASGTCNLYLAHDGELDFIARLNANSTGGEADMNDANNWAAGHVDVKKLSSDKTARVSDDGQILVFRSQRQLTDYDNQGPRCAKGQDGVSQVPGPCLEFYRFDHAEMSLACMTCDPRGVTPEGPARLASLQPPTVGANPPAATLSRNLSRDGNRFFFETVDALVAEDTNGAEGCPPFGSGTQEGTMRACQDVYEWEAPGTGSCTESSPAYSAQNEGCIYLISTGKSTEASFFADADLDGENAFIFTYEQLVPQDKDALLDAYDARIGGGLASQHQVDPPPCTGEACKAAPSAPLAPPPPGSSSFSGPTNVKERKPKARRCAKGKRRVRAKGKVRCVAKRNRRAARKSRRAGR
jgi:hypothetical protein